MTEKSPPLVAPWRIGVDVGGTFTDMVLRDNAGAVRIYKSPSVPADPSQGVLGVLRLAAETLDMPLSALLRDCALFVHGSTVATNTILEKKGAKVGMLTTEGFRDSLEIRRGFRENQWDHRAPFPEVLAPRYLRLPVRGRIGADGGELAPLVAADVEAAARTFAEEGVESVAVCLFNSFIDGGHERAVGAQLAKSAVGKWVSLSSDVMPTMGEYERGSTAVVNAYVSPKVTSYLRALDEQLRQLGLRRSLLLLLQSNGGAVSVEQVAARPVMLVLSGPAAGVGALRGCTTEGEPANFISMEIGGTSCDVMVMADGDVPVTDSLIIDGYHLTTPSVEIHTVGAGGGTVAWVDAAGLLHAGPQGAGARPGPAAYGLGGENPTVTDAQLVLGRLRPGPLAGGVTLDAKLAYAAIDTKLAKPLGLSVEDAAAGVIRLLEQNLLHAVERLSIERGHNPATFTMVAAGGAGPMHGSVVAKALGCKRALLPRAAGAFCAMGMLQSDIRQDYLKVFLADLDKVEPAALEAGFAELKARAGDAAVTEREVDLRYEGQQWPVRVALAGADTAAARRTFEAEHQRLFGHIQAGGRIDITALRLVARDPLDWTPPAAQPAQTETPKPREVRKVWLDPASGWRDVPIYDGADLRPGCRLNGPLLIEERTTTAFVGVHDILEVDARDDFLVHIGANP